MVEFAYNNAKNANISYAHFELNCRYYLWVSYKEDVNSRSKLKSAKKLSFKLRNLIAAYEYNLHYAQEL